MGVGILIAADKEASDDAGCKTQSCQKQREYGARRLEIDNAQGQCRYQRTYIGLEQVRAHAGHVADIVTDVIRDNRRVSRVILRDARLNLTDQVGTDIGCLRIDTAAHTGKQCDGRCTQAEARKHIHVAGDQVDHADAQHAEACHAHTHDRTACECGGQGSIHTVLSRRIGGADIRLNRNGHAEIAGQRGEQGAEHKADGGHPVADSKADEHKENSDKDDQNSVLREQEGVGTFTDGRSNLLHALRSCRSLCYRRCLIRRKKQRADAKHGNNH